VLVEDAFSQGISGPLQTSPETGEVIF
jgi:hypothetical protein